MLPVTPGTGKRINPGATNAFLISHTFTQCQVCVFLFHTMVSNLDGILRCWETHKEFTNGQEVLMKITTRDTDLVSYTCNF